MSIIGKLFGSDKALEKVVDTAKALIDESFYTDQEQAADRTAAADKSRAMVVEWLLATTGSRLARRLLALSITGMWLTLHTVSTLFLIASIWTAPEYTGKLISSSEFIDARSEAMQGAVLLILGFYFAAPYMGDIAKGALQKFNKG